MQDLLIPRFSPVNRSERRKFEKEHTKLSSVFYDLETAFIENIFTLPRFMSYSEIYNAFLLDFKELENQVQRENSLMFHKLKENYFIDRYKPIEGVC